MLKTLVKVSAITNLSDARYCAGMGVDFLGFPMGQIPIEKFMEIRNWLAGVKIVGEFFSHSTDEIKSKVAEYQPDILEIDSKVNLVAIQDLVIPKILRVNIDTDNLPSIFAASAPYVNYFLLVGVNKNSLIGMEGSVEIWSAQYPIILGLDIPESDIAEWVEQSSIKGIGLVAGDEDRPGFRDFTSLMNILEKLETE
jgi:phosphoribosylanthranilate isomerase